MDNFEQITMVLDKKFAQVRKKKEKGGLKEKNTKLFRASNVAAHMKMLWYGKEVWWCGMPC